MHKKFEINQTKTKDVYESGRKVTTYNAKWRQTCRNCTVCLSTAAGGNCIRYNSKALRKANGPCQMTAAEKERCSWLRHTHVNVHWEYWKNVSLKEQKIDRVLFPGSKDTGTIHLCVLLAMGESENGEEERRTCLLLPLEAEAWIENGPQEEVAAPIAIFFFTTFPTTFTSSYLIWYSLLI